MEHQNGIFSFKKTQKIAFCVGGMEKLNLGGEILWGCRVS
jgi:hypothetical protein